MAVFAVLIAAAGAGLSGSADQPEITDATGDVNVEVLIPQLAADGGAPALPSDPQAAAAATDISAVWIPTDSEDSFTIMVRYADLPAEPDGPGAAAETWIYFTVNSIDYRANITLFAPSVGPDDDEPLEWRTSTFLFGDGRSKLTGDVNADNDEAFLFIPRALIGSPDPGDMLTKFWAVTRAGAVGPALDYAPGATAVDPFAFDPSDPTLTATPTYGTDYVFGPELTPSAALTVVVPDEREVREGASRPASITVKNDAATADTVQLAIDSTPSGWTATLNPSTLTLEPGESRSIEVSLRPATDASDYGRVVLRITSSLGADEMPAFDVVLEPAPAPTPPSDDQPSTTNTNDGTSGPAAGEGSGDQADGGGENGTPFPGVGLIAISGAAAALGMRRRS